MLGGYATLAGFRKQAGEVHGPPALVHSGKEVVGQWSVRFIVADHQASRELPVARLDKALIEPLQNPTECPVHQRLRRRLDRAFVPPSGVEITMSFHFERILLRVAPQMFGI